MVRKTCWTYTKEAANLRYHRDFGKEMNRYKWSSNRDDFDMFDLLYLFDEEEIQERKQELLEETEYGPRCYDYDEEYHENMPEQEDNNAVYVDYLNELIDENWENPNYNFRFDMRLGFYTDDYDSGYDEPNSRKEPYSPLEEEESIDQEIINERLANLLVHIHLRRGRARVNA